MPLSTGLYMLMYMLFFLSALKLGRPEKQSGSYQIPKGFRLISAVLGLIGCVITIIVGFQPYESGLNEYNLFYCFMIASGFIFMIALVAYFWRYKDKSFALIPANPAKSL
jgi:hypothetical protein